MRKPFFATLAVCAVPWCAWSQAVSASAAARFLEQASWGPTAASIAHVQEVGFNAYLTEQFAQPATHFDLLTWPIVLTTVPNIPGLQRDFFVHAMTGPDQLRQRVAFALHEIWMIAAPKINDPTAWITYMNLLLDDAFADYSQVVYDVTLNPGMGHYLDMVNNDKPPAGQSPNENYSRELMQLFTLGEYVLNPNGMQKISNGATVPTYSETDVQNLARVFTGWTYAPHPGAPSQSHNSPFWMAPMVAVQSNHDKSSKTVLGTAIPANLTAEQDLAQGLHIITSHPNLAPFISKQLIEHLVKSNPSTDYVGRVSSVFTSSNGNLQQVVQAILLDTEARQDDAPGTPAANSGHLREPLVYIVGLLRALNATVTESNNLAANGTTLGQDLFYAPSVFSYFSPNYHVGALVGPEFQIQSPSTANLRADFVNTLVYGSLGGGTTIDLTPYVTLASNSGSLLDALDAALMHGQMPTDMRSTIQTALAAQTTAKLKAQAAIYLVASSSQYQVEH